MTLRLLIADDEAALLRSLRFVFARAGFEVDVVTDGQAALDAALSGKYDVAILDVMMPSLNGIEVCREVRRQTALPIVLLTAKTEEIDAIVGLEVGADDYVRKPFVAAELVARVRAVLRRRELDRAGAPPSRLSSSGIELDIPSRTVRLDGHEVRLTPAEFDILALFLRAPGRAFTRRAIMDAVNRGPYQGNLRVADVHVANLRRKLEADPRRPRRLLTLRGTGYGVRRSAPPARAVRP